MSGLLSNTHFSVLQEKSRSDNNTLLYARVNQTMDLIFVKDHYNLSGKDMSSGSSWLFYMFFFGF